MHVCPTCHQLHPKSATLNATKAVALAIIPLDTTIERNELCAALIWIAHQIYPSKTLPPLEPNSSED